MVLLMSVKQSLSGWSRLTIPSAETLFNKLSPALRTAVLLSACIMPMSNSEDMTESERQLSWTLIATSMGTLALVVVADAQGEMDE